MVNENTSLICGFTLPHFIQRMSASIIYIKDWNDIYFLERREMKPRHSCWRIGLKMAAVGAILNLRSEAYSGHNHRLNCYFHWIIVHVI